jgi:hypothetical protein
MGYTTTFQGRFYCYRPESEQLGAFLKAVREGDQAALAPLADWLGDQGDARGEAVARLSAAPEGGLDELWRLFALRPEHAAYLLAFRETRRMKRDPAKAAALHDPVREAAGLPLGPEAGYFVGGGGLRGQDGDESVLDYNWPPQGQPGLWCHWVPDERGTSVGWDGGEKFYDYVEWLQYLLQHFLGPWGYLVNGEVSWQGEEDADRGTILVADNVVRVIDLGGRRR